MIANHIHDAIAQVTQLQELIIEKRQFHGYSGRARFAAALSALLGAAILASDFVPSTPHAHLFGWGLVLIAGLAINYGALAFWLLSNAEVRRHPAIAKPALDAIPPLAVGAMLSLAAVLGGSYDLLFGIWMCLFGLTNVAYRRSMPRGIYGLGLAYIACGSACLILRCPFLNPWPMGLVFFAGETIGGFILLKDGDAP
jgi:hypothetical protein